MVIRERSMELKHFWEMLLACYGTTPFHPGKGTAIAALARKAGWTHPSPSVVKRRGIFYELDRTDLVECEIYYKTYEPWETLAIDKLVGKGSVCLDVGANVGYYTLLLSSLSGNSGQVHAFEPSDATFAKLHRNVQLNSANNVHLHKLALSRKTGNSSLVTPAKNAGGARLTNELGFPNTTISVSTLDHFAHSENLERLDFIKADIEGSEFGLLEGGINTIQRFRPKMLIEINPRALASFGDSAE